MGFLGTLMIKSLGLPYKDPKLVELGYIPLLWEMQDINQQPYYKGLGYYVGD